MDIERKLDLIQQMHREQAENERYIYEKDSLGKSSRFTSFRFRLLVAMLLFLCFFIMDKKEIVYGKMDSSKIIEQIESNLKIEDLLAYLKIEVD
ncbi:MAG: hypothetical protein IKY94_14320 [Lachnospiraceae bacterium]|nr:hypothetical protein [Lachnospiraceae bacterium]